MTDTTPLRTSRMLAEMLATRAASVDKRDR
jgi:hypothetical protein